MSLHYALGDQVIAPATLRAAGTYASGPVSNPGAANYVLMMIVVTAVGGSTQTIDMVLQTSDDNSSYTSQTPSAITQLTAVGNAHAVGYAALHEYAQVLVTIGGTGSPTATFSVACIVL